MWTLAMTASRDVINAQKRSASSPAVSRPSDVSKGAIWCSPCGAWTSNIDRPAGIDNAIEVAETATVRDPAMPAAQPTTMIARCSHGQEIDNAATHAETPITITVRGCRKRTGY